MKISKTHQAFANYVGQEAITNPEPFLGPNYKTVLNFWYYLDTLTEYQWNVVHQRRMAISYEVSEAARDLARNAAEDIVGVTNRNAAYYAAYGFSVLATIELIVMHIILAEGKTLLYVPLFDSL